MTTLVLRAFSVGFPRSLRSGFALVTNFFSIFNRSFEARRTWDRLHAMSDGQLARKGIARQDIPRFVGDMM